jgi:hypothetical protein
MDITHKFPFPLLPGPVSGASVMLHVMLKFPVLHGSLRRSPAVSAVAQSSEHGTAAAVCHGLDSHSIFTHRTNDFGPVAPHPPAPACVPGPPYMRTLLDESHWMWLY